MEVPYSPSPPGTFDHKSKNRKQADKKLQTASRGGELCQGREVLGERNRRQKLDVVPEGTHVLKIGPVLERMGTLSFRGGNWGPVEERV